MNQGLLTNNLMYLEQFQMSLCDQAVFLPLPTKQMTDHQPQYQYYHLTDESKIQLLHIMLNIQINVLGLWALKKEHHETGMCAAPGLDIVLPFLLSKPCSDQTQVGTQTPSEKSRRTPIFFHLEHLYSNRDIKMTVGTKELISNLLEQIS